MKIKIILVLIILTFSFVGVKCFYLNKYDCDKFHDMYENFLELYEDKEIYTVVTKGLNDENYLSLLNLKLENKFDGYLKSEDFTDNNYIQYSLSDNNYISLMIMNPRYKSFDENNLSAEKYVKDNDLDNEVEFMDYVYRHNDSKINIFSSIKDIKNNYIVQRSLASLGSEKIDQLIVFNGELVGYALISNNYYSVYIEEDGKVYGLSFGNSLDSLDELKDILNTIVIE